MRISDWSSDVCSSDLYRHEPLTGAAGGEAVGEADARVTAYAEMVRELVQGPEGPLDAELLFEPGRLLVGNAGVLVTRVLYVKDNGPRRFVIVEDRKSTRLNSSH